MVPKIQQFEENLTAGSCPQRERETERHYRELEREGERETQRGREIDRGGVRYRGRERIIESGGVIQRETEN